MIVFGGEIHLKKGKEFSIQRNHPWIFSGAIDLVDGELNDGCWVKVFDSKGNILGYGHFQEGSISVRIISFGSHEPKADFWSNKIKNAILQRKITDLPSPTTNAFRLIHGEGDGLSGLIIDFYNGVAVMQAHSYGMHADRVNIANALKEVLGDEILAVYYKSKSTLKFVDDLKDEFLLGDENTPHTILENGNKFFVDWITGQKTGFFLDQRDNRNLLAQYSKGRSVLNTFCYTGGFSVYALKAGATFVHSVDASAKAIELTRKNIELNGFDSSIHTCTESDTVSFLETNGANYDIIVLDPPAFAKHRSAKHQAIKGYQRLNAEAMKVIKPGGIIFTFSCSQVIDRQLFYSTVVSAAIQSGRDIKVLHHLSQPADHPVSIYHPEGEYLKGLVLYVS